MKKIMAIILVLIAIFSLNGCSETDFDAKSYVQAVLDAKFQREYADYAKIVGVSEKEAKEQMEREFNEALEDAMKEFDSLYGITEEEMAKYTQLEADVRSKIEYIVKDAVKDEDGNYAVEVLITPINAYENWDINVEEKLTKAIQSGATKEQYMGILLEGAQECFDNVKLGEKVTFTFHVVGEESEDKVLYGIHKDEMLNVDLIATGQATE